MKGGREESYEENGKQQHATNAVPSSIPLIIIPIVSESFEYFPLENCLRINTFHDNLVLDTPLPI